jgi:hypothetical protein
MEVSGCFTPEKELNPLNRRLGGTESRSWQLWRRERSLALTSCRNLESSAHSLVPKPTILLQLWVWDKHMKIHPCRFHVPLQDSCVMLEWKFLILALNTTFKMLHLLKHMNTRHIFMDWHKTVYLPGVNICIEMCFPCCHRFIHFLSWQFSTVLTERISQQQQTQWWDQQLQ